jgi:hypothetical protein
MTKKHFIYAANQIIEWCDQNGTPDFQNCPFYNFAINMFYEFDGNFNPQTFTSYIKKGLIDLQS